MAEIDAFPSCKFYVEVGGAPRAVFTEVSGLQVEVEVTDYLEGGNNNWVHRLAGRTKASNVTFKRGLARSDEFLGWLLDISRGQITPQNVSVVLYDIEGQELRRWTLQNAYPVKWVGPQLGAGSNTVAVETLELAHAGLKLG